MADEAAEFWEEFEKETGEKVVSRSIGELYESSSGIGAWGILILTDKSFRFKYMPSDNWFSALMKGVGGKKSKEKAPIDIVISREDLVAVAAPKRGFLGRLLGPAFPRFTVTNRNAEGEVSRVFTADPATKLLEALQAAVPGG